MKSNACIYIVCLAMAAAACAQPKLPAERECLAVLESDAGLEQKARACQQLSIVGTGQSVSVLAGLLDHEHLGDYARFALEQIDDESVDQAFRDALDNVKGRRLAGVIGSIGARGDAGAVGKLTKFVYDDSRGVSSEAVAALGRIASADAVEVLNKVLAGGSGDLRTAAAEACLAAGQRLMHAGENAKAVALFDAIIKADVAHNLEIAAAYNAIIARGEAGLPLLVEKLKTDDRGMNEIALLAARQLADARVSQGLAAELPALSPATRVLVIKALLDRDDPSVAAVIRTLAESDDMNVRLEALKALGQIGDSSAVDTLLKAANASKEESDVALAGLLTIQAEGIEQKTIQGMIAAPDPLKAALIDVIAARRFASAAPLLLKEAASKNETVAIAALKALSDLAEPQALPALAALLIDIDNTRVAQQAETTVAAVALKEPDKSKQADEILAKLASTQNAARQMPLLRVLGRIGNDQSLTALKQALASRNDSIRDVAIRALAACPNPDALETLLVISDTAPGDTHRILALRGYIRLLGADDAMPAKTKARQYAEAMSRATRAPEKKLVLAGLSRVSHPGALKVIADAIDDESVRDEAVLASLSIAQLTAGAAPDHARTAAEKIARITTSPDIKAQALALIQAIDGFGDFIVAWEVTGFYTEAHCDHNTLLWMAFEPELPNNDAQWSLMPAATDPKRPWMLDLLRLYPGDNRVAYARTWIHADKPHDNVLELGTDDGVKVWLNNHIIHNHGVARTAAPGSDKVRIPLKQGPNLLMLKISQNSGPWEFCANISSMDGLRIDALRDDLDVKHRPVSIFDGKTFTGWEGNLNLFRIEDGAIVGGTLKERIVRNEFLCTHAEYGDFELRLKVRLLGHDANAGIQIRSRRIPNHHEMIGYQTDMGQHYWGCLYDESRRNRILAGPDQTQMKKVLNADDWNDYVIRCEGNRVRLWINGLQTIDYTEPDDSLEQKGVIGLQIHSGPPAEAWYKDIVITEL